MSIQDLYSSNTFFSKKLSHKKSSSTSNTEIKSKAESATDQTPNLKRQLFANQTNKNTLSSRQRRQVDKKEYPISKFYPQQEQDQDLKIDLVATETSIIKQNFKTKNSLANRDKPQSNFKSEQKIQPESLVEELYAEASNQLLRVNELIQSFNKKISRQIKQEFKKFRQVIINTIDKVFSQSSETFKKIIEKQQAKCLSQIQSTKQMLESLYSNIEKVKNDGKSSRKKMEQEIKNSEIEEQLNQIKESINKFEQEQPKININIDKKRINAYDEALQGLLQLQDQSSKPRRNY